MSTERRIKVAATLNVSVEFFFQVKAGQSLADVETMAREAAAFYAAQAVENGARGGSLTRVFARPESLSGFEVKL